MKLFNPLGSLFKQPPPVEGKKPTNAQLFDDTAIDQLANMLTSVPDPDLVLEEAGLVRSDLRRMEYDDEIATAVETRLAALQSVPWRVEPGEGDLVDFIWEQIAKFEDELTKGAWAAVPYGYSVMEVIYERQPSGRIGIGRVEERPFEWFEPRPDGSLRYFPQDRGGHVDVDTRFKFMLTRRNPSYRNPYGQAVLSRLYAAFFLRQAGWRFWPQFLERFGTPLLVGKTRGKTADMAVALQAAIQAATLAIDSEDEVTAVASTGDGAAFERFEIATTKRIQKVILGQTLTTDVGKNGSYAAAQVHNLVREDRKTADIKVVSKTLQHLVNALVDLNQPGIAERPVFVMDDGAGLQLDRAERDAKLAQAGIAKFTDEYLMRAYEFEREDFEVPANPTPPATDDDEAGFSARALRFSVSRETKFTPTQQAVEDLADAALSVASTPISPEAIAEALRAAKSPEDLTTRLAAAYEGNQPDEFREILERALFAADVMGYAHDVEQNDA